MQIFAADVAHKAAGRAGNRLGIAAAFVMDVLVVGAVQRTGDTAALLAAHMGAANRFCASLSPGGKGLFRRSRGDRLGRGLGLRSGICRYAQIGMDVRTVLRNGITRLAVGVGTRVG